MESKRVIENKEIFREICRINNQYSNDIVDILLKIQVTEKLTTIEHQMIASSLFCNGLRNSIYSLKDVDGKYFSYNDNRDRENCDKELIEFSFLYKNYDNIYKHISNLIEEGNSKMLELSKQFKEPKKIIRKSPRQKLIRDYLNDRISEEEFTKQITILNDEEEAN